MRVSYLISFCSCLLCHASQPFVVGDVAAPTTYEYTWNTNRDFSSLSGVFRSINLNGTTAVTLSNAHIAKVQGTINLQSASNLKQLTMPALVEAGSISMQFSGNLTNADFPLLTRLTAARPSGLLIFDNGHNLNFLELTNLVDCSGDVLLSGTPGYDWIHLPALTNISGSLTMSESGTFTNVDLSALVSVHIGNILMNQMSALATLSFPSLQYLGWGIFDISEGGLSEASVNGLLATLVSLKIYGTSDTWTGNICTLAGGTSAAPSGQGATDKATLVSRGVPIVTN